MTRSCARRVLCWTFAAAGLPLLWACQSHRLSPPDPRPERVVTEIVPINPTQELDVVFLIDTSESMKDEQVNLRQNFPAFMRELEAARPNGLDVHIAIISSNLGAPGTGIGSCENGGDRGEFRNQPAGGVACTAVPRDAFIIAGPAGNNFDGPIADVFSCIATVGTSGCGFEHQLASLRRALGKDPNSPLPAKNNGFLRPNARLGIVLITDEDDCSAPPDTDLFRSTDSLLSSPYGQFGNFRCQEFGHLCGGQPPPRMPDLTLNDCHSNETASSKLIHVSEFVSAIKSLKADPDQIVVAAITAPATPYTTVLEPLVLGQPERILAVRPACTVVVNNIPSDAYPAVRIHEFVRAFGTRGFERSICTTDFATIMAEVARAIVEPQNACIEQKLVDLDRTRAGVQPDCAVTELSPHETGNFISKVILPCERTGGVTPCWSLAENRAGCPANKAPESFEIKVERGGAMPPADARLEYSCLVCAGPADPRCQP